MLYVIQRIRDGRYFGSQRMDGQFGPVYFMEDRLQYAERYSEWQAQSILDEMDSEHVGKYLMVEVDTEQEER